MSDVKPTEAQSNEWWAEGKAAAEQALLNSTSPIFLKDEYGPAPQDIAKAMGWNAVWASEENRRRFQRWRDSGASTRDSKSGEWVAGQLRNVMAAAAVRSGPEAQD